MKHPALLILGLAIALFVGCRREPADGSTTTVMHKHEHKPPHHGTPVVLGNEQYHLELVLDRPAGRLQAYILDGELENFVRVPAESFPVATSLNGKEQVLTFKAVANSATGETVGHTALFEARADWLTTNTTFDGVLQRLAVRGTAFEQVKFNFPKGNDSDESPK